MPRTTRKALALCAAAAALGWAGWLMVPATSDAVVAGVDVIAAVAMLAGLPRILRRLTGPPAEGRAARLTRTAGAAALLALVLVKSDVLRRGLVTLPRRAWPAGLWTGEIIFLLVIAAYQAGLLALTARRRPAGPTAAAAGACAGVSSGLVLFALPPVGRIPHFRAAWGGIAYEAARGLGALLVGCAVIGAGVTAARRISGRTTRLPLADARPRQGAAAGLCAGTAAALAAATLGIAAIAVLPHSAMRFQWTLPVEKIHPQPGSVYPFEVSLSRAAAGYLLVLLIFPVIGAGLGAWGGLYVAERSRRRGRPGDGGGGGGRDPVTGPPDPAGGQRLDADRQPAILCGYLKPLPGLAGPPPAGAGQDAAPGRRQKTPAGQRLPAGAEQAAVPVGRQLVPPPAVQRDLEHVGEHPGGRPKPQLQLVRRHVPEPGEAGRR